MIRESVDETISVSGKRIRLTAKQWVHIIESHDYMSGNIEKVLETVNTPDCVVKGRKETLIALKHYPETSISEKDCVVVYKENKDGFVITGFFTSKPQTIKKGNTIWEK